MFLKEKGSNYLVEVLTLKDLFDPFCKKLVGRYQHGEEPQDPANFKKEDLVFPSGEPMPKCWTNAHYRDAELQRTG